MERHRSPKHWQSRWHTAIGWHNFMVKKLAEADGIQGMASGPKRG